MAPAFGAIMAMGCGGMSDLPPAREPAAAAEQPQSTKADPKSAAKAPGVSLDNY
jgi:hypothetical protein